MSSGAALDIADIAAANVPGLEKGMKDETLYEKRESVVSTDKDLLGPNGEQYPTEEEWGTLRRVYGKVSWMIYIIGIVEMCERFAYYGTTAVCKS
jgi:POT family proton-dependent oligopeptide transporter